MATAIPDLYSQHMIDYTSTYFKRLLLPFTRPITLFSHRLLLLTTLERGAFAPSLYRAPSSSRGQGTAPYRIAHSSVTMRQDGHGADGDNASSRRPQVPPRPYRQHRLCVLNIPPLPTTPPLRVEYRHVQVPPLSLPSVEDTGVWVGNHGMRFIQLASHTPSVTVRSPHSLLSPTCASKRPHWQVSIVIDLRD